jgi:hypothetical protein
MILTVLYLFYFQDIKKLKPLLGAGPVQAISHTLRTRVLEVRVFAKKNQSISQEE